MFRGHECRSNDHHKWSRINFGALKVSVFSRNKELGLTTVSREHCSATTEWEMFKISCISTLDAQPIFQYNGYALDFTCYDCGAAGTQYHPTATVQSFGKDRPHYLASVSPWVHFGCIHIFMVQVPARLLISNCYFLRHHNNNWWFCKVAHNFVTVTNIYSNCDIQIYTIAIYCMPAANDNEKVNFAARSEGRCRF